ncbi:MAG TPA: asparagine synthase (glutamine-hydrolyzing) [Cyclobacteriaceae bacterium]|nr:asparagine synthase (glutamine-hydrolyzing) [Cyclobacteriaceae bacterium]
MCGINGFISDQASREEKLNVIKKMNLCMAHRGPDNDGNWSDDLLAFGHRRLSIIDLSTESNQPFFSNDQRYVIVYNGELYNYRELKLELQRAAQGSQQLPYFFKSQSDTEVVLAAYIRWGAKCLDLFNGMYAFAIYDTHEKTCFIGRDRHGVKPLYYYYGDKGFLFSSEVRPILHSGIKTFSLNRDKIAEYVMYQTVLAPHTLVKGIKMLLPGHYMTYANGKVETVAYYSNQTISREPENLSYTETCSKVNELLSLSVQRRLVADVPFGAFLSGGIDSSAVVGLMSKVSKEQIQTFNVSFDESEFSESQYARLISKKFNTKHHEIKLRPDDFLKSLPEALHAMDHPSGDGPNTYIVSKATKSAGITMALSGIGGDELFAGYDVFKRMHELNKKSWVNHLPLFARKTAGWVMEKRNPGVGASKKRELLAQDQIQFNTAYPLNRSVFTLKQLNSLVRPASPFQSHQEILSRIPQLEDHLLSAVSLAEINTYLQNTLLRDTDQMSMAVALEVREPFLDYKLIEFVLGVKDSFKYPHSPKKLLTDSLGDLLPREIMDRPKMGFTLPWQVWLKNELKSMCESNLMELSTLDVFIKDGIQSLWKGFLANEPGITWSRVWHLVVLNHWIKENNLSV